MDRNLWIVRVSPEAHRRLRFYSAIKHVYGSAVVSELILKGLPPEEQLIASTKKEVTDKFN